MSKTFTKLKHNPIFMNGLMLGIFCIAAGLALGLAYESTKTIIAEKKEAVTLSAFESVFGQDSLNLQNVDVAEDCEYKDSIEKIVYAENYGYAIEFIGKGYKGDDMEIVVGFTIADNKICGVQIVSHDETAGLGANATKPSFLNQFAGFDITGGKFVVVKNGADEAGEIDALSGATKTSKGVTDAVNQAIEYFNQYLIKGEQ